MPFNALPKSTLLMPTPGNATSKHLYVVLTPHHGNPPRVVVVNVSTKQEKSDCTTILYAGEHPFLKNPESIIRYDQAQLVEAGALVNAVNSSHHFQHQADVSDNVYQKIINGLMSSDETPVEIQTYCQQFFPPTP
jgi:hypothetical protein